MRRFVLFLYVVAFSLLAGLALAQQSTEDEAAKHFERGVELYQEGSLDAALVEFERAYELVPNPQLLFNIAQVQTERHEYVLALELFQRYLTEGGVDVSEQRRAQVREEIRTLKGRIAELWVETNVEGAELYVNDTRIGLLPLDEHVLINSGICKVRVEKPGYTTATQVFKVAGGERPRLNLQLSPEPAAEIAAGQTAAQDTGAQPSEAIKRPNRTPFWVSLGATGALGGATLAFGLLTKNANDQLDEQLDQIPTDPSALNDARGDVKRYAALTDGFGAASIVAAGVAIYFLINPPMKSVQPSDVAKTRSIRVVPSRSGASLVGTF